MTKIKDFFNNIFSACANGLEKLKNKVVDALYKFGQTPFMMKVKSVLSYIPNKLSEKISYRKRQSLWGLIFVIPLIIGMIYFFFIPLCMMIAYAFSFVEASAGEGYKLTWIAFDNFGYLFREYVVDPITGETFLQVYLGSVLTIFTNVPVILIFSLLVAVVLNTDFKGRAFVRAIFFMPVLFNSQAINNAMKYQEAAMIVENVANELFNNMFNFRDFMLNANLPTFLVTFLGTITDTIYDIISYSGIQILIFLSGIQSVPKHLYEAAKIEGATQYEIFWKITFPMVSPLMMTAAVYTIVDSFMRSRLVTYINLFSMQSTRAAVISSGADYNFGLETYSPTGEYLGHVVSKLGINGSMSILFIILGIIITAVWMLIISIMVFYYDE